MPPEKRNGTGLRLHPHRLSQRKETRVQRAGEVTPGFTIEATAAVLSRYVDDGWHNLVLTGTPLRRLQAWIERIESNPLLPPHAAGKPLAWLFLLTGLYQSDQPVRVVRQIGLLTDLLRTLEHELSPEDVEELEAMFTQHGRPCRTTPTVTPPFL